MSPTPQLGVQGKSRLLWKPPDPGARFLLETAALQRIYGGLGILAHALGRSVSQAGCYGTVAEDALAKMYNHEHQQVSWTCEVFRAINLCTWFVGEASDMSESESESILEFPTCSSFVALSMAKLFVPGGVLDCW
jgi:hypothetical protein